MTHALTLEAMSPGLLKVVERAKREPEGRLNALAHLIDVPALQRAYRRQRADAAVGGGGAKSGFVCPIHLVVTKLTRCLPSRPVQYRFHR